VGAAGNNKPTDSRCTARLGHFSPFVRDAIWWVRTAKLKAESLSSLSAGEVEAEIERITRSNVWRKFQSGLSEFKLRPDHVSMPSWVSWLEAYHFMIWDILVLRGRIFDTVAHDVFEEFLQAHPEILNVMDGIVIDWQQSLSIVSLELEVSYKRLRRVVETELDE
jgi:hypothetical protein